VTLLAAAGVLSMLAQVIVLRELVAALFGVELLYIVALGTWLLGTGLGALAGRRSAGRNGAIASAFVVLGGLTLAELVAIRTEGVVVGAVPGAYLPFPLQIGGVLAATLPPALVSGFLFPALVARAARAGWPAARAYAAESAGAAAGGVLVTIAFWLGLSTLQAALAVAGGALVAAATTVLRGRTSRAAAGVMVSAGTLTAIGVLAGAWDVALLRAQYPSLVAVEDTPYARVVVTRSETQLAVFTNGAFAFDTEGTSAEAFADLAALQHPRPRRALVFGGGVEGIPDALVAHGVTAIQDVEVDARADAMIRRAVERASEPRRLAAIVRLTHDDPRLVLERQVPLDLIVIAMPPPTSGEASRYYTAEFFTACTRRLADDGVLAIRLPGAENLWPPPLVRMVASVTGALAEAFPHTSIVPGATLYAFGSRRPLPADAGPLVERLASRRLRPRLMTPPYLRYLYGNDRRTEVGQLLTSIGREAVNRDAAPVAYGYAAVVWLSTFYPALSPAADADRLPTRTPVTAACLLVLAVAAWWGSRTRARAGWMSLLVVSAATMGVESVVLLQYQVLHGVMFVNVGALLTCFMAGLAVGAWRADRAAVRRRLFGRPWSLTLVLGYVGLLGMALTRFPSPPGWLATGATLAFAGGTAGLVFGALTHERPGEPSRAVGAFYAADVFGGAVAAWLAPLVLIPVLGLDGAAALAGAAAVALLPLGATLASGRR